MSCLISLRYGEHHKLYSRADTPAPHTSLGFCPPALKNLLDELQRDATPPPLPPLAPSDLLTWPPCVLVAHPDRPEAARCAGGGAGRVPPGSQTVHGVRLRPGRMSAVSGSSFLCHANSF